MKVKWIGFCLLFSLNVFSMTGDPVFLAEGASEEDVELLIEAIRRALQAPEAIERIAKNLAEKQSEGEWIGEASEEKGDFIQRQKAGGVEHSVIGQRYDVKYKQYFIEVAVSSCDMSHEAAVLAYEEMKKRDFLQADLVY